MTGIRTGNPASVQSSLNTSKNVNSAVTYWNNNQALLAASNQGVVPTNNSF